MVELIDAHHHLWHYSEEDFGWLDSKIHPSMEELKRDYLPEDLRQELATAGVDGSVAVQARQSLQETHWLLACAKRMPAIRGVVGWVPLASPKLHEILNSLAGEPKLKGLRHVIQDEPDEFFSGADFNRGVAALGGTGLVYDILIYERQLPQTLDFARRHPGQSFVLDHLAKPSVRKRELEPWRRNLKELAREPGVSCKLSGLVTEAEWNTWTLDDLKPYLDAALEAFGPDRLMAGSDWPVCLVASSYKRWWAALHEWAGPLTTAEREQIFGRTAKRIYSLADAEEQLTEAGWGQETRPSEVCRIEDL